MELSKNNNVEEAKHVVDTLKSMKSKLERERASRYNDFVKSRALGYACGGTFLASNILVGLCCPAIIGGSLLVTGALFGSLVINQMIECHAIKKNIKSLNNKIQFFEIELKDANFKYEEIERNNNLSMNNTRHQIKKIYRKEELFGEFKKNENKYINLERKELLDKYLSKKGYNNDDIEIFNEFVEQENCRRTNIANMEIEAKQRALSKSNHNNIGLYY